MSICATGTTGLIGRHLQNVSALNLDLLNLNEFDLSEISSATSIIHLAGIVGLKKIQNDYVLARKVNFDGTIQFARIVRDFTASRFVFVSTSHVYKPALQPVKEFDSLDPINLYGELKLETENALIGLFSEFPERLKIARVFSVLGCGMPEGTLGWAIDNLSSSNPLKSCDDVRDFLEPGEIASKLLDVASKKYRYQVVNVCSGIPKTIRSACLEYRINQGLETMEEWLIGGNSQVPHIVGNPQRLKSL